MTTDNNIALRVCFVCPKAYPLFNSSTEQVFGGSEVDLYYLATELAKDPGFVISFIVADHGQPDVEMIEGVTLIKSLDFRQNELKGAFKIWKAMRNANADIYMLKTASPGVPLVAYFCKRYRKVFCYRTAHAHECDGTFVEQNFWLGKAFIRSLRSAGIIFAQNVDDAKNLKAILGLDSIAIPNGHRIPDITAADKKNILWVGRSANFKKPYLFLDLARRFANEQFVMVCQKATGDNNYQDLLTKAKQIENLTFIEQVPFAEIDTFFRDAKIFVNTSDAEGFPNTFIQAGKCAAAILSLNVNPDSFLDEYNCGFSCNRDQTRMTEKLKYLMEDERYIEYGLNARRYVCNYHDIEQIIAQYKDLFTEVCPCR